MCETGDLFYIILFEILDFGVSASVEGFEIEELRMTKQNCNNNKKKTFAKSLLIA